MASQNTKLRPLNIAIASLALTLLVVFSLWLPIFLHQIQIEAEAREEKANAIKAAKNMGIQGFIETSKFRTNPLPNDILNALLPFESISLDRSPCLGDCDLLPTH